MAEQDGTENVTPQEDVNAGDQPAGGDPGTQAPWYESIPEDLTVEHKGRNIPLREHPKVREFKNPHDVVKSYVNALPLIGDRSNRVKVPGEGASEKEMNEFYKAIGRPESPDEYKFDSQELPEGFELSEEGMKSFKEFSHKIGLSANQAKELHNWYLQQIAGDFQSYVDSVKAEADETIKAIETDYKQNAEKVFDTARRAAITLGGEQALADLDRTGAGNSRAVIELLYKAGQALGEEKLVKGDAPAMGGELTREKLREMKTDPKYWDASRRDPAFVKQIEDGYKKLFPGEKRAPLNRSEF